MDMREMVDKVKKGEPLYGTTDLTPYMQGVAARNSRYSAVMSHIVPWPNLVNHNQVRLTFTVHVSRTLMVNSMASILQSITNRLKENLRLNEQRVADHKIAPKSDFQEHSISVVDIDQIVCLAMTDCILYIWGRRLCMNRKWTSFHD